VHRKPPIRVQCAPVPARPRSIGQHRGGRRGARGRDRADQRAGPGPGERWSGGAWCGADNSILVGETAVLMSRGASLLIAKNSVFHGTRNTDGAFTLIDLGGNTFE
jgi:hypothetical protein